MCEEIRIFQIHWAIAKKDFLESPSMILLYHRGASLKITMSKLVNSPFKGGGAQVMASIFRVMSKKHMILIFISFITQVI